MPDLADDRMVRALISQLALASLSPHRWTALEPGSRYVSVHRPQPKQHRSPSPTFAPVDGVSTCTRIAAMAPSAGLQTSTSTSNPASASTTPGYAGDKNLPPLARSATAPTPTPFRTAAAAARPRQLQGRSDPSHLAPEDAFLAVALTRRTNGFESAPNAAGDLMSRHLRMRSKGPGSRSRSRRRKRPWKKLLWVKQSCKYCCWLDRRTQGQNNARAHQMANGCRRSGQLYRPGDIPRESAEEPATEALRILATGRRLDSYRTACLHRHHLRRVLCGHPPAARKPCRRRQLGHHRNVRRLVPVGLVGGERDRDRQRSGGPQQNTQHPRETLPPII